MQLRKKLKKDNRSIPVGIRLCLQIYTKYTGVCTPFLIS